MDTNAAVNGMNMVTDTSSSDVLSPATSLVNQLLDVSPPVAMALVLACIYSFFPTTTMRKRVVLDFLVIAIGAAVYPELADPGKVGFAVHNPVMAEVVTGALLGCGALILSVPVRKLLSRVGLITSSEPAYSNPQPKAPDEKPAPAVPAPPAP
jgi:hypothetical protein